MAVSKFHGSKILINGSKFHSHGSTNTSIEAIQYNFHGSGNTAMELNNLPTQAKQPPKYNAKAVRRKDPILLLYLVYFRKFVNLPTANLVHK